MVEERNSPSEILPMVIAHRGASSDAPENTLASFRLAFEQGVTAIEGDFRLTKDGKIVCIHDSHGRRTLGRNVSVSSSTLAELKKLSAGKWKGEKWKDEKVPTLEEVLKIMPSGSQLFLEVKCGPEIIDPLAHTIKELSISSDQLILISYNKEVLRLFKERFPDYLAYLLVKFEKELYLVGRYKPDFSTVLSEMQRLRVDGLDSKAQGLIDAKFVGQLKDAGFPLYVWTVNDEELAQKFISLGVEGITTDRPSWLLKYLQDKYPDG